MGERSRRARGGPSAAPASGGAFRREALVDRRAAVEREQPWRDGRGWKMGDGQRRARAVSLKTYLPRGPGQNRRKLRPTATGQRLNMQLSRGPVQAVGS
jgi:hypothetical protein